MSQPDVTTLKIDSDFSYTRYAELFASRYQPRARFVRETTAGGGAEAKMEGQWISWDKTRGLWVKDPVPVRMMALELARDIYDQASLVLKTKEERRRVRRLLDSQNPILKATSELDNMWILPESLDGNPMLFKLANGTLDLRNVNTAKGPFRSDDPEDLITMSSPAVYDPKATCFSWLSYLKRVQPEEEIRTALQLLAGYSLTGDTSENVFYIFEGQSRAGKGVFKNTMRALFGDYAMESSFDTFLADRYQTRRTGPQPDLMEMFGKRLVFASEAPRDATLDDALIKRISGSDVIRTRGLYERTTTGRTATFKVVLLANTAPRVDAGDQAIWERVRKVAWQQVIPLAERDKGLEVRLAEQELSGILNWVLAGLSIYQIEGVLPLTESVINANREYRSEMDPLGGWFEENITVDETSFVLSRELHYNYQTWCKTAGITPLDARRFGRELNSHYTYGEYATPTRVKKGRGFSGLKITTIQTPF